MQATIKLLKAKNIDPIKWDACIDKYDNGLIYNKYVYLNTLAAGWRGIIFNDYEAVFPLCIRYKYGLKILYKPTFIQQLGLTGNIVLKPGVLLSTIQSAAKGGEVSFNYANKGLQPGAAHEKTNYIIDLAGNYRQISTKYTDALKRNLRKAAANKLSIVQGNWQETLDDYYAYLSINKKFKDKEAFTKMKKLLTEPAFKNHFFTRKVIGQNAETLATAIFLIDKKRIYNIAPVTNEKGKMLNAMHFLIDQIIQEFERTCLIFDFEGSELPGVKNFYKKFSPIYQPYYSYQFNTWPLLQRWL